MKLKQKSKTQESLPGKKNVCMGLKEAEHSFSLYKCPAAWNNSSANKFT